MTYDPSHRKPRHAGRMPQVITPEVAWPALAGDAYADDAGWVGGQGGSDPQGLYWSPAGQQAPPHPDTYPGHPDRGYRTTAYGYPQAGNGWAGTTDGFHGPAQDNGWAGTTEAFHGPAQDNGWAGTTDGFDGAWDGFDGSGGYQDHQDYPDYPGYEGYPEPTRADPALMAPDAGLDPGGWQAGRREPGRRGLIVGAVTGFLAAGMAIGVATLAAAFVRPQASPIIAVGEAFIDRTPSALKEFAIQRFGENDKTMLLLGMYVAIALLAMGIGILARRITTIGVVGIAAFSLFGAFVAITRPESRASDVIPSVIGGIAGVAALLWLQRASAPITPARQTGQRTAQHGRRAR